jgi:hypothetical protein
LDLARRGLQPIHAASIVVGLASTTELQNNCEQHRNPQRDPESNYRPGAKSKAKDAANPWQVGEQK